MTTSPDPSDQKKLPDAKQLFVWFAAFIVFIIVVVLAFFIGVQWNWTFAAVLACTCGGLLVIALPIEDWKKSAIGVFLATAGYLVGLPGMLNPVDDVQIIPFAVGVGGKEITVTVGKGDCRFQAKGNILTCNAQVRPAE
jgi:hypothetical protein